jgi:hypothetical protein
MSTKPAKKGFSLSLKAVKGGPVPIQVQVAPNAHLKGVISPPVVAPSIAPSASVVAAMPAEKLVEAPVEQITATEEPKKLLPKRTIKKIVQLKKEEDVDSLLPPLKLALQQNRKPVGLYKDISSFYPQNRTGFTQSVYKPPVYQKDETGAYKLDSDGKRIIKLEESSIYTLSIFKDFKLPPKSKKFNPDACTTTSATLEAYPYQKFVREYMQQANPSRGLLVYHGLGSGKTCTSIAAAEALYGQSGKKLIVLTPISLKENFLNEMMNCGFRQYRLKPNVWTPLPLSYPSNPSKEEEVLRFAQNDLGVSEKYLNRLKKQLEPASRVLWIADLSKPNGESNFDTLSDSDRTAIRDQLYDILQTRYMFIGYTGLTITKLLQYAKNRTFDDSVIVIDEVHNLTRLMAGKLEPYFVQKETVRSKELYDPITVDAWDPELPAERKDSSEKKEKSKYTRAYALYRLLTEAKNSKLIALSGTPIVNQPTEIGILGNILHGYFHSVKATLSSIDSKVVKQAEKILAKQSRVNFFTVKKGTSTSEVFCTILDYGYIKEFTESHIVKGVKYVGKEAPQPTIYDLYKDLKEKLNLSNPIYEALPLFPPTIESFSNSFVDVEQLKVKNNITFVKRFSGLISYYKGFKEELMPTTVEHPPVECPFSALALGAYSKSRLKEINEAPKSGSKGGFDEVSGLMEKESTSYRFRSRAGCNFSFPSEIIRPFPGSKEQMEDEIDESNDQITDRAIQYDTLTEEGLQELQKAETEEKEQLQEDTSNMIVESVPTSTAVAPTNNKSKAVAKTLKKNKVQETVEPIKPKTLKLKRKPEPSSEEPKLTKDEYKERLAFALNTLYKDRVKYFSTKEQLQIYSNKYALILDRIKTSRGSNLVYSQFKTVEGIGIFAMVLDANGFVPIKLKGPDTDLELEDSSKQSILTNPEQPRYIFYSGGESIRVRQTLINIFNMRLDKLPIKIASLFKEKNITEKSNLYGKVCNVFMITGAGAEGLSLKNVSAVHIMEPYWNKVRTDQVKGRAVRICSHSDLPYDKDPAKNQRKVDVYTYISTFEDPTKIDETIRGKDKGKTTDQHILELAEIKEKVSSDFLCHMKAAAVDCKLNISENETTIQCFNQMNIDSSKPLYDPRLEEDLKNELHSEPFEFCKKVETKESK